MKQYITDSLNLYTRVTNESSTHYICGDVLYSKSEVITDYSPLDDLIGKLKLNVVPFYNY